MSDAEMPECFVHDRRKARKTHKCCECHGAIQKGELYHHMSGVWAEGPDAYKVCFDCEQLREDVDEGHRLDEVTAFEGLFDAVFNGAEVQAFMVRFIENADRRGSMIVPGWARKKADPKCGEG